jgi:hydroxymethylpyrimidine/phosphomethylpyrimidine kinase
MEQVERPRVLVIAGFDQSGGAGILSDIKTLEAHGVYGYAVCTGMTWQNERVITRVEWYREKEIFEQIDLCMESGGNPEGIASAMGGGMQPGNGGMDGVEGSEGHETADESGRDEVDGRSGKGGGFEYVKIGIGRSIGMIGAIIRHLRDHNPAVRIVLDPVIRASSGVHFWEGMDPEGLEALAAQCYLLTPNWEEMGWLYPGQDIGDCCRRLSASCNLYLKGGHHPLHPGRDYLWTGGGMEVLESAVDGQEVYPKHGSGCVLSSALAANLSLGYPLPVAAPRSKRYIERFLTSNKTLLGWHRSPEDFIF